MFRLRLVISMVLVMSVAIPVTSSSVSAHEVGNPSCPATYLCVWVDAHHLGQRAQFAGSNSNWGCCWGWIHDDDSSSKSAGTSGLKAKIWKDAGPSGQTIVCLSPGTRTAHHNPNDEGSANSWPSTC